jgi:predicted transcriptional regulator YdeE
MKGKSAMLFTGYGKSFSTQNEAQYDTIGAFWDQMARRFGRENLRGLGFGWGENSIEYVIGLKEGDMDPSLDWESAVYRQVPLPDDGWIRYTGKTDELPALYDEIYKDGPLLYEIEAFWEDGGCEILIRR